MASSTPTPGQRPNGDSAPLSPPPSASDPSSNTCRCFVCLVDEPKGALPPDWATPCNCSLQGHQDCLLAWVSDLEAQSKEIKCPVCKTPIVVTERYDAAIQLSNYLNRKFSRWSPLILLGFAASGALVGSSVYGATAIHAFAGPEATISFLFKSNQLRGGNATLYEIMRRVVLGPQLEPTLNLLHVGLLPFIAPALVLNRLNVNLEDILMFPATILYATFSPAADLLAWPPPPQRALALYPAFKAAYYRAHRALSTRLEKRWAAQSLRQLSENGAGSSSNAHYVAEAPTPNEDAAAPNHGGGGGGFFDFELEIELGGGGGEQDVDVDDPAEQRREQQRNRALDSAGTSPFNFLTGALLFPGVCYGAGELLRAMLPSRVVTARPGLAPTGLLQLRWGRSLIGGCLFVALKDAFFLFVRYRQIMNRPYRRIKNSDRRPEY
ncbi:hypothetical protein F4780DRAFT_328899 [Xylariomycetidae sp. FL0641]|nr:hypothetical protein F4780DRAFT_328899 [Xylariomycetidae sp. FL0641]